MENASHASRHTKTDSSCRISSCVLSSVSRAQSSPDCVRNRLSLTLLESFSASQKFPRLKAVFELTKYSWSFSFPRRRGKSEFSPQCESLIMYNGTQFLNRPPIAALVAESSSSNYQFRPPSRSSFSARSYSTVCIYPSALVDLPFYRNSHMDRWMHEAVVAV